MDPEEYLSELVEEDYITEELKDRVLSFIDTLESTNTPNIAPGLGGEIVVVYSKPGKHIEFEIFPDGSIEPFFHED